MARHGEIFDTPEIPLDYVYVRFLRKRKAVTSTVGRKRRIGAIKNSTKLVMALTLALMLTVIMVAVGGINDNSPAGAAALPLATGSGHETPVRATKGDRLDTGPKIRKIAGVTVVMRDFSTTVR
jgi:hypothetical protein